MVSVSKERLYVLVGKVEKLRVGGSKETKVCISDVQPFSISMGRRNLKEVVGNLVETTKGLFVLDFGLPFVAKVVYLIISYFMG